MRKERVLPEMLFIILGWAIFTNPVGTVMATQEINMKAKEFAFIPERITVDQPGEVSFTITNTGEFPQGFKIEGVAGGIDRIDPGQARRVSFTLRKGSYTLYCPLRGHRERGMEGSLGVSVEASQKAKEPARAPPTGGLY
ncbi:MAG: cupredoxin domain-containing protein [Candidatus Methylomirabilales bacterium]